MTIHKLIEGIIEDAITNQPRSLQVKIGPSELGNPCDHCFHAKLAGWEETRDAAFLPFVGTAVHAALEGIFRPHPDFLTERRVSLGYGVDGTCDLFHVPSGTAVDFKVVGQGTLTKSKKGPSVTYRVQTHGYGLGYFREGFDVQNVAIYYLPRNSPSLRFGHWWSEGWQPMIAIEALERMERVKALLLSFASIEERDAYITNLPRAKGCYSCARYPDAPKASTKTQTVESLLGL